MHEIANTLHLASVLALMLALALVSVHGLALTLSGDDSTRRDKAGDNRPPLVASTDGGKCAGVPSRADCLRSARWTLNPKCTTALWHCQDLVVTVTLTVMLLLFALKTATYSSP